jgi:hypothetical protein
LSEWSDSHEHLAVEEATRMQGVDHEHGGGFHPMSHLFAYIPLATGDNASVTESGACAECRDAIERVAYTNYNSRVNEVIAFTEPRIIDSSQYWSQLESVENPADQDAACAALYKYLFANLCEADRAKGNFETTMARCYLKERLNILELVVWKALCLVQIPSTVSNLHEWNAWCRGGWKSIKPQVRHASGLAVVMSGIFPFISPVDDSIQRQATRHNVEFGNSWFQPGPQEKKSGFHPVDHLFVDFSTIPTGKRVACSACEPWSKYHILTKSERIDSLVWAGAFSKAIQESSSYWPLMRNVYCHSDQVAAMAAQIRFIFGNKCEAAETKDKMVNCIAKCIFKERLTMLELAVWKSLCMMQAPNNAKNFYEWNLWCSEGWKGYKADSREVGELQTIISCVLPFLRCTSTKKSQTSVIDSSILEYIGILDYIEYKFRGLLAWFQCQSSRT